MDRSYLPAIAGYIDRPRLDALYAESLEYQLVTVVAGPGYGKTLSAARFFGGADVRLVWVHIKSRRGGADSFWEDFLRAAAQELPLYAKKLEALGFPDEVDSFERFRSITAEEARTGRRLVFVVDNYESISDSGITLFLDSLGDSDLTNFTLYILCNVKLPFAEVKPAKGQFRITDTDLAFTVQEAGLIFEHYGIPAERGTIEYAVEKTGGWPLALRLACTSRQRLGRGLEGKTYLQLASELFEQQYFMNFTPGMRLQLVKLSLLPYFSLDMMATWEDAPNAEFSAGLRQHPFVSYDYATGLYTFQPMYHRFLRRRQAVVSREACKEALVTGGRWFLEAGMVNEAMDCFWDAADYDGFLETLARMPIVRYRIGLTNQILERLERIPPAYADAHPRVGYCMAFMLLNAARMAEAKTLLLRVQEQLQAAPQQQEHRQLLGDIYVILADISVYMNRVDGLGWMEKAWQLIPGGTTCHSATLMALGNNSAFYLPENGARLRDVVEYFTALAHYVDKLKKGSGQGFEYLFAGEAAFFAGAMQKAAEQFNSAILKAAQAEQHDILCNALWGLMRMDFYFGNYAAAAARLKELCGYINGRGLAGLYELRDCAEAWFRLRLGDSTGAPAWLEKLPAGPEEMPAALGRNRLMVAWHLTAAGQADRAHAVLVQLEQALDEAGRWYEKLWLHIALARHHQKMGEAQDAGRQFYAAYAMVYGNDLKVALAEFGRTMMALIDMVRKDEQSGCDMDWLDEVYRDAFSYAKRLQAMARAHGAEHNAPPASAVALTRREDETLRYLAQGLTQQEIAKLMGISSNAVKKHVAKIYFKLGAVNRADAIHIASINGLVDLING